MRVGGGRTGGSLYRGRRAAVCGCCLVRAAAPAVPPVPTLFERVIVLLVVTFWAQLQGFVTAGLTQKDGLRWAIAIRFSRRGCFR